MSMKGWDERNRVLHVPAAALCKLCRRVPAIGVRYACWEHREHGQACGVRTLAVIPTRRR